MRSPLGTMLPLQIQRGQANGQGQASNLSIRCEEGRIQKRPVPLRSCLVDPGWISTGRKRTPGFFSSAYNACLRLHRGFGSTTAEALGTKLDDKDKRAGPFRILEGAGTLACRLDVREDGTCTPGFPSITPNQRHVPVCSQMRYGLSFSTLDLIKALDDIDALQNGVLPPWQVATS